MTTAPGTTGSATIGGRQSGRLGVTGRDAPRPGQRDTRQTIPLISCRCCGRHGTSPCPAHNQ